MTDLSVRAVALQREHLDPGAFKQVLEDVLQPAVRCTLVAVALNLYEHRVPGYTQKRAIFDQDGLHTSALSSIPNIASRSNQPSLSSVFCLLLLSHTWAIAENFKKIPIQWCLLARIIFDNCEKGDEETSLYSREFARRTDIGLSLQESALFLVNNYMHIRPHSYESNIPPPYISDEEWHSSSHSSDLEQVHIPGPHTFFALFQPFINIVKRVAQEPGIGSPPWIEVIEQLEDYFFQFPERLLKFNKISHLYQFEAMIWLHGLFIVLYSTRDFINLLKKTTYLEVNRFNHLFEHSLLLGEIIPHLLSTNPHLESLTSTTIYLLCISSAIHCLALRQFIFQSDFAHISPPAKLITSTQAHIELLRALEDTYKRCDLQIIREFLHMLSTCLRAATRGSRTGVGNLSCEKLYLYRWTGAGTGMVQMREKDADLEWDYAELPSDKIWDGSTGLETELVVAILQMCEPAQRLCRSGFFDLSIMIPM
ncbi:hypothetical protein N7494_006526 [Penicillium frequentans]|uniref:Transcription factor domain-containing protein n=1 Tax=Penicillium frequentans TaxID=3151616 RepID=A0AAD6CZ54_9EURO|nr:hypothetical protein N7494_006526 [Penicillium glabrum]